MPALRIYDAPPHGGIFDGQGSFAGGVFWRACIKEEWLAPCMLIVWLNRSDSFDWVLQSIGFLSVQGFSVQERLPLLHGSCSP
jgi:hypothetical protein